MDFSQRDLFLLGFLAHASDSQLKTTLRCLTRGQYTTLKNTARKIVEDEIPLTPMEFQMLQRYGQFIEKLADASRIRPRELILKKHIIVKLSEIAMHHNETHSKSRSVAEGGLGTNGKRRKCQTCQRTKRAKNHAERQEISTRPEAEAEAEGQTEGSRTEMEEEQPSEFSSDSTSSDSTSSSDEEN